MWEQNGNEILRVPRYRYKYLREKNFQGVSGENTHGAYLRGYPETHQQRHASIKQHPCGNERQDDRMERVYEA
jgi:hypothetical protein